MQLGGFRTAVVHRDAGQDILGGGLGVLDKYVEVTVVGEHTGVHQLVFKAVPAPTAVFLDQLCVGKLRLRVFVEELHVGVRRRRVKIEVVFLHILAVVAFAARQSE